MKDYGSRLKRFSAGFFFDFIGISLKFALSKNDNMIRFGYRNRFSAPLRAVLFIALGALMIIFRTDAMELIVKIIASFILAAGVVSFIVGYRLRSDGTMPLTAFNGVTDIVIALLLFLFAGTVAKFISYLLGLALLGFGLFQISVLVSARSRVRTGFGAYVIPVLVSLAGLFIFCYPSLIGKSIGLIAGISLVLYGISELIAAYKLRNVIGQDDMGPDDQEI